MSDLPIGSNNTVTMWSNIKPDLVNFFNTPMSIFVYNAVCMFVHAAQSTRSNAPISREENVIF